MKLFLKYIPILIAMIYCEIGYGQTTVTFIPGQVEGGKNEGPVSMKCLPDTMSNKGITVTGTAAAFKASGNFRFYQTSQFTVSSAVGNIIKIVFTEDTNDDNSEHLKKWKANIGTIRLTNSNKTATWTGNSESVTFTISLKTYISEIQVTYEPSNPQVEFTGNNDAATITSNAGKTVNATIKRSLIADGGWYTLCLPFDATDISPLRGAEIKKYKEMNGTTMVFEDATEIKAGYPYIIKPTSDIVNPVFGNVVVKNEEHSEGTDGYYFVATLDKKELTTDGTNLFLGADNKFYIPLEDDRTLFGLRGYFTVPEGTNASKMSIKMEDEPTSIQEIRHDEAFNYTIHNISGLSVGSDIKSLPKGIYIHNGKKFAIK